MESSTLRKECSAETGIRRNARSLLSAPLIVFRAIRVLNLDIPAGAVCSSIFAAKLFHLAPSPFYFIIVFLALWVIYSADDIIDGIRSRNSSYKHEYRFHYKKKHILIPLIILSILIGGLLSFTFLEPKLIFFGLCMILAVALYFAYNTRNNNRIRFYLKEITIAVIYTTGIFGGMILLKGYTTPFQILIILNFLLVAYSNVLMFSLADLEKDKHLRFNNFTLQFGVTLTKQILLLTLSLSLLMSLFTGIYFQHWNFSFVPLLMTIYLVITYYKAIYLKKHKLFGIFCDSVFFLPILSVWI